MSINAEAQQASTSFQLAHVRTEKENGEDRTSVAKHPLFNGEVVTGAPLVKEYKFDGP